MSNNFDYYNNRKNNCQRFFDFVISTLCRMVGVFLNLKREAQGNNRLFILFSV